MSEDISKEPAPRRKTESEDISKDPAHPRMPGSPDYEPNDYDYDEEPPFPRAITAAGTMLIVFGGLVLLNLLVSLALQPIAAANAGGRAAGSFLAGNICGAIFLGLVGAVFIQEGVRGVRGTLRDTLGTGVASIAFGVLILAVAAFVLFVAGLLEGGITGLVGAMLVVAGILALVGRSDYRVWREWRKAQKDREAEERRARRRFQK
jgi:hypothetical protein